MRTPMLALSYDTIKTGSTGMIFVFLAAGVIVMRSAQKLMFKVMGFIIMAALAVGCWAYRDTLQTCVKTCSCSLAGHKISIPASANQICAQIAKSTAKP